MRVRCNKCGHEDEKDLFLHRPDGSSGRRIYGCPKCDNEDDGGLGEAFSVVPEPEGGDSE